MDEEADRSLYERIGQLPSARFVGKSDRVFNLHRGGKGQAIKITPEERSTAVRAAKILGLNVCGVDMLRSNHGPVVMEVNSTPGLEGIESATGEDIAGRINCVTERDVESAHRAASAIDEARTHGKPLGALAGLPMTIKDGFDVAGLPAVAGNSALRHRARDCVDAEIVACARAQGAVIWGKSNVPFMLGDFQTYNSVYGTTNNPYDVSRTAGGSSGGAAAALAAGVTPLEIGSDIGGSLRHPASFCGVYALKPTWGTLSQRGHVPPLPGHFAEIDLQVTGPMARNAGDLRLLWNALRARGPSEHKDIRGTRIFLWDHEAGFPLAREVRDRARVAAAALDRRGAAIETAKLPFRGEELVRVYLDLMVPILGATFPDGLYNSFLASRVADLEELSQGVGSLSAAAYRVRATASYRDVVAAMTARQAMKDKLAALFDAGIDAILCPVDPIVAFEHSQNLPPTARSIDVDGVSVPYMSLLVWIALATALHNPAIAAPGGLNANGLPIGVQLIGRWHGEDALFDLAMTLEEELGGFRAPVL
jgi:amidase